MDFLPEPKEQIGVDAGELLAAVDAHVTAEAQRNVQRPFVHTGAAMMHHQARVADFAGFGQTGLAAAVSRENGVPQAAETELRVAATIVAGAAETAC